MAGFGERTTLLLWTRPTPSWICIAMTPSYWWMLVESDMLARNRFISWYLISCIPVGQRDERRESARDWVWPSLWKLLRSGFCYKFPHWKVRLERRFWIRFWRISDRRSVLCNYVIVLHNLARDFLGKWLKEKRKGKKERDRFYGENVRFKNYRGYDLVSWLWKFEIWVTYRCRNKFMTIMSARNCFVAVTSRLLVLLSFIDRTYIHVLD